MNKCRCGKKISFYAKRCTKCEGKRHSIRIKKLFKEGRYKNRDQSYRTKNWKKRVGEIVSKRWKEGVYTKTRNKKISKALKGIIRTKRIKKNCKTCKKIFKIIPSLNKYRQYCSLKCFYRDPIQIKRMKTQAKNRVFSKERNLKISKSMKGILPKNWIKIIKRRKKYWQIKMYKTIKKYFPQAKYEYRIDINKNHRRFLDTAIIDKKIDFEYDGMIHLSYLIKQKDIIRDKQLCKLGWKTIRINKDNYCNLISILEAIK